MTSSFIMPLSSPDATLALAGGKGMNLSRLIQAGFPTPGGFIVTTDAYRAYVAANNLQHFIRATINAVTPDAIGSLKAASAAIRGRFAAGQVPREIVEALRNAYGGLDLGSVAVAVRSSATAEDLPDLSFAGQQDTFLNIVGEEGADTGRGGLLEQPVDRARHRLSARAMASPTPTSRWLWWCRPWCRARRPACCSLPTRSPGSATKW